MLRKAIFAAHERFKEEIERASKGKKVDIARIKRRQNELYHVRLTRACLGISQNSELNDSLYSLAVALPEGLMSKMHFMGWGDARKQKKLDSKPPELLKSYFNDFASFYNAANAPRIIERIKNKEINKCLICHGLSPASDTILLLAELGRSIRLSKALGLDSIEILLADISWIKYNRSIGQKFDRGDFLDKLRVCIDKRKRLYHALGIRYTTFGITDYGESKTHIKKNNIMQTAKKYRELSSVLWGDICLKKQDSAMKAIIGKSFHGLSKQNLGKLPEYMQILLMFRPRKRNRKSLCFLDTRALSRDFPNLDY